MKVATIRVVVDSQAHPSRGVTVRGSAPQEFSDPEHPTFHQCGLR